MPVDTECRTASASTGSLPCWRTTWAFSASARAGRVEAGDSMLLACAVGFRPRESQLSGCEIEEEGADMIGVHDVDLHEGTKQEQGCDGRPEEHTSELQSLMRI